MATITKVPSRSRPGVVYTVVEDEDGATCTCPDAFYRKRVCDHVTGIWGQRAMARLFAPATGEAVEPWERCWWVGCKERSLPGEIFCGEHLRKAYPDRVSDGDAERELMAYAERYGDWPGDCPCAECLADA